MRNFYSQPLLEIVLVIASESQGLSLAVRHGFSALLSRQGVVTGGLFTAAT
jgi:hypothetical protein